MDLPNRGRSLYDTLLRQGGGRPFNLAPFPPVLKSHFDCGTIFTLVRQADGTSTIRTFDIPMPNEANRSWEQQDVLTGGSIRGPSRETGGFRYHAPSNSSGALLIFSPPHCHRYILQNGHIDANAQWRSQAQDLFRQGYTEVYLVTDVWSTNRWAADLRTEATPENAEYTATTVNGGQYNEHIAPDFIFNHNSLSGQQFSATYPEAPPYTVLALVSPIQQRGLGRYAPWLNPFVQKLRCAPKKFVRRVLRKPPSYPSFPSGVGNSNSCGSQGSDAVTDTMFKLPLGGTFSLVEIISGENINSEPEYCFESEGHREDFCFESFCTTLEQKFNVLDWKYALQSLFPPQGQLPVLNLPPEFDFRRHTPGRSYTMPATLSQSLPMPPRANSLPTNITSSVVPSYAYTQSPLPGYPSMAISPSSSITSTGVGWTNSTAYSSPPSSIGSSPTPMYATSPMSSPGILTPPSLPQTSTSYFDSKPSTYAGQSPFLPASNYNAQPTCTGGNAAFGIATVTAVPETNGVGYTGAISPTIFPTASVPRRPGW